MGYAVPSKANVAKMNRETNMRPDEARPRVLRMYRLFRQEGRTPDVAMQMVRNSMVGLADTHPRTEVDIELPPAIRSEAAMCSYVAGRYLKAINSRRRGRPFWNLGFMPAAPEPSIWDTDPRRPTE